MSDETTTVAFMLRSALPIDDVDQVEMLPGQKIIVVWVDVQDRPDLTDLAARHGEGEGSYLMTWFAASPKDVSFQDKGDSLDLLIETWQLQRHEDRELSGPPDSEQEGQA